MNILEYQAKHFFKIYSIPVLDSGLATTPEEAFQQANLLKGEKFAVKAQVLAGGRGKGGGIKLVNSPEEARLISSELLGKPLITPQTSKQGEMVNQILIEKACNIEKEYYLAVLLDPATSQVVFMASSEGGMDIEEVALKTPDKIIKTAINLQIGFSSFKAWDIGQFLGLKEKKEIKQFYSLCQNLYRLFMEKDANLLEINPLVKTSQDEFIALDGKMSFDENALYRHPDLKSIYKSQTKPPAEEKAARYGFSFIQMEGEVACMVNGAGLAMATMDMLKLYGGNPANFLDVGGGAEEEKVKKAFEIILTSKKVKSLLINIFGGIMQCDVIAEALIKAAKDIQIHVPIVVRLEGTRAKEGMEKLNNSSLDLIVARDLDTAAKKAVELSKNS